jgi:ferredoxin-type protein NapH
MADNRCAVLAAPVSAARSHGERLQRRRRLFQAASSSCSCCAPALNLLRFDLNEAQLWLLGQRWSLGIAPSRPARPRPPRRRSPSSLRGFVPALLFDRVAFLTVAWRYGRLYCGWLCPHFSSVEMLNDVLHRACGKLSLWDKTTTPRAGSATAAPLVAAVRAVVRAAGLWLVGVTLLTYLLPPATIWGNLVHGTLTPNQARFIAIGQQRVHAGICVCAPPVLPLRLRRGPVPEPGLDGQPARHGDGLRPRPRARLPQLRHRQRARWQRLRPACPMRLRPRNVKRLMFSCVQCGRCGSECETSQGAQARAPLLQWTVGADALRETLKQRRQEQQEGR